MPTGLDPWNQLLGKMPGHYVRLYEIKFEGKPPLPEVHWPDQEPLAIEGTFPERLNAWLTLVQRGEVVNAYRVFLGLWDEAAPIRPGAPQLLAQLVFAGLIDVQDRMLHNRSYTTGHKSYRARATVELGEAVGWDHAHDILYAGVPDMAVGPRWYSTYEMGCLVVQNLLDGRDRELLGNDGALTRRWRRSPSSTRILSGEEPAYIDPIVALARRRARAPRQIIDTIQVASAQVILETGEPEQLLDGPAQLRVLQHGRVVLRHLRASRTGSSSSSWPPPSSTAPPTTSGTRRTTAPSKIAPPRRAPTPCRSSQLLERLDEALHRPARRRGGELDRRLPAAPASTARRSSRRSRPPRPRSATTRTTRSWGSACSRTTRTRTARRTATGCSSPAPSTPPATGSTATHSRPIGASRRRSTSLLEDLLDRSHRLVDGAGLGSAGGTSRRCTSEV